MTIYIINCDEANFYRFWNRKEHEEVLIFAESVTAAKKEYRKTFALVGKNIRWRVA